MSTLIVGKAVDRTINTYTMMGMRGDEERRQSLREIIKDFIQDLFDRGQQDEDRLVVGALKHLVSLESRPELQRRC